MTTLWSVVVQSFSQAKQSLLTFTVRFQELQYPSNVGNLGIHAFLIGSQPAVCPDLLDVGALGTHAFYMIGKLSFMFADLFVYKSSTVLLWSQHEDMLEEYLKFPSDVIRNKETAS